MATLLSASAVLPMEEADRRRLLQPGAVLVDRGVIAAVGPPKEFDEVEAERVNLASHALIPGLHNCHLHSGLLRGTAEDLPLLDWLRTYVDPMHRALTPEIAEAASRLCYAESLLAGATSVMDMWRFLDRAAVVASDLGLRATLVPYVCDGEGLDYFESLDSNRALLQQVGVGGRVRAWVGLEHLLYCTPRAYEGAIALAAEFGTQIHTHSSEQQLEITEVLKQFGRRPIHELHHRGLLDDGRCVIAHCVWLDDAELDVLAETGTRVAHCPVSNMKLASGVARIPDMWARGVTVGLGSDGEKENNNLDLLEEMKVASLVQKLVGLEAALGNAWDVLAMATIEGARCLGLERLTGSIEPGKAADLVAVDLRGLHTTPVLSGSDANIAQHLVFAARASDVTDVWVEGRHLVAGGRLVGHDVDVIRSTAQAAAEELFERRRALTQS